VLAIEAEPLRLRRHFAVSFRIRKEPVIVSGLAARYAGKFAAGVKLFERIGARGVLQAIVRALAANIRKDERLCHQVGKLRGNIAHPFARDRDHGIEQKLSGKHAEPPQNPRLCVRQ
jgi:hypothetical protein